MADKVAIFVRVPKRMRRRLRALASERGVTINSLVVSAIESIPGFDTATLVDWSGAFAIRDYCLLGPDCDRVDCPTHRKTAHRKSILNR